MKNQRFNIFKTFTMKWWQTAIQKLSVLCIGIAIGAYWTGFFQQYVLGFLLVGILLGLYIVSIWWKQ